jgi:hypothetical protein
MGKGKQPDGCWNPPAMWEGETVFIIGGGPSLAGMDLSPLHGRCVLGVNAAWELGPWVKVTYFGDKKFWTWNHARLTDYPGLIVTSLPRDVFEHPRVKSVRRQNRLGIHWRTREHIMWNRNSGASAINLALHFGAARAVLLGFDMQRVEGAPNGGHNWHGSHQTQPKPTVYKGRFIASFDAIKRDLADMENSTQRRMEVVNATPGGALETFRRVKLEDVI